MTANKPRARRLISLLLCLTLLVTTVLATTSVTDAASYRGKYWIKVNTQQNVVTVYKRSGGKWTAMRAMRCSAGVGGTTPCGTFYLKGRWNWGELMNGVYGQYCTHITSDILFHSVYYNRQFDKKSQPTSEFNKLGTRASHGCVRLSVMDAKWIYDNCPYGTKVTIYRSRKAGPLGKPKAIKVSSKRYQYWDPTDPDPKNPYYKLRKPIITVSAKKKTIVQYGSKYNLKSYVTAKDPNTFMKLTNRLTVYKVRKYSSKKKKYVTAKFNTKSQGTYKVTYRVRDPYSGTTYKTIKIQVIDKLKAPTISGAKNRTVTWGSSDAIGSVTAKQPLLVRTKSIVTAIKAPGETTYKSYTYQQAKKYVFAKEGKYTVRYTVKNKYKPYRKSTKTITITSKRGAVNADPALTLPSRLQAGVGTDNYLLLTTGDTLDLRTGVQATHNKKNVTDQIQVAIKTPDASGYVTWAATSGAKYTFTQAGTYSIRYTIKNRYTPYQTITRVVNVQVQDPPPPVDPDPDPDPEPSPSPGGTDAPGTP